MPDLAVNTEQVGWQRRPNIVEQSKTNKTKLCDFGPWLCMEDTLLNLTAI